MQRRTNPKNLCNQSGSIANPAAAVGIKMFHTQTQTKWLIITYRIAQCQTFYTDKFYPQGMRVNCNKFGTKLNEIEIHCFSWGKKAKTSFRLSWLKVRNPIKVGRICPKTTKFYIKNSFTSTFQYFYTDISAISVTICNSELT